MKYNVKKMAIAAMFAAVCCVATMIIKIPSPLNGYINLGDCVVLLAGWLLSPLYGFVAAGLGSALADLLGYALYAPATFVIKGTMAIIAYFVFKKANIKFGKLWSRILSGILAESAMILGYFLYESYLYGATASIVNIPANAVQGIAGIIIGVYLASLKPISKLFFKYN